MKNLITFLITSKLLLYCSVAFFFVCAFVSFWGNAVGTIAGNTSGVSAVQKQVPVIFLSIGIMLLVLSFFKLGMKYAWILTLPLTLLVLLSIIGGLFSSSLFKATPRYYFSGEKLKFYQACSKDDLAAAKAYLAANPEIIKTAGRDQMPFLGLAVLKADKNAINNLMKLGADPLREVLNYRYIADMAVSEFDANDFRSIQYLHEAGFRFQAFSQRNQFSSPWLFTMFAFFHWGGAGYAIANMTDADIKEMTAQGNDPLEELERALKAIYDPDNSLMDGKTNSQKNIIFERGLKVRGLLRAKYPENKRTTKYTKDVEELKGSAAGAKGAI